MDCCDDPWKRVSIQRMITKVKGHYYLQSLVLWFQYKYF